jgi:hypothetical protein
MMQWSCQVAQAGLEIRESGSQKSWVRFEGGLGEGVLGQAPSYARIYRGMRLLLVWRPERTRPKKRREDESGWEKPELILA